MDTPKEIKNNKEVRLKVMEAVQDDVNKGIVKIDSAFMKQMEVNPGDIVEIKGERSTAAIVDRAYPGDIGLNIIRMDGNIRRNARTSIGEMVTIVKADIKPGKKISLAPVTKGVMIKNVISNSSANIAGIQQVNGNDKEIIQTINNKKIEIVSDYHDVIASLKPNSSILLRTNKASYRIFVKERFEILEDEGFDEKIVEEIVKENITVSGANGTNETIQEIEKLINKTISVPKTKAISRGAEDIGLRVGEVQRTNIKLGLDLQGGTRVLLQPEKKLSPEDLDSVISIIVERLNIYGLSDIVVRGVSDLSNNQYIMIEIAGATDEDVKELIAKQGKFEAKIANQTVFVGGKDITYVCKSSECAGIERCDAVSNNQYACRFRFAITMTQEAAERHADITRDLQVVQIGRASCRERV